MNISRKRTPADLLVFGGGFQHTGGIEAFTVDLMRSLSDWPYTKRLVVWGKRVPALEIIQNAGTTVTRSSLQKGCRFALPDFVLIIGQLDYFIRARTILFTKLPPDWVFRLLIFLLSICRKPMPQMIYVTAYRPSEMWPKGLPRLVRKFLTKILVQADVFRDDIRSMGYSGPVGVLPLIPPEPATIAGPISQSTGVVKIGFVGRLVAQKNVGYLLAIANELKAAPLEFHIYGGGEDEAALRLRATATSVNVKFHGAIERHAVLDAIDSCDAIAVTSISEGQCLVALEALSRGKPLLATPVGALPEILHSGRFGVELPLGNEKYAAEKTWELAEEIFRGEWSRQEIISKYAAVFGRDQILHNYRQHLQGAMELSQR